MIVAFLLIGVVLLQRSKDQGLGLAFGSGMGETLFGSQAVNVLVKITIVLSIIFFLNTMILARMFSRRSMRLEDGAPGARPLASEAAGGDVANVPIDRGESSAGGDAGTAGGGNEADVVPVVPAP